MRELSLYEIDMVSGGDFDAEEVVEIVVEATAVAAGAAVIIAAGGVLLGTVGTALGTAEIFGIGGAALRTVATYAIKEGLKVAAGSGGVSYTLSKVSSNLRGGGGHMAIP